MFLSSSASNCVVGSQKEYDSSSGVKNSEFVQHCQKLLLLSLLPEQPSFGLFQELQNTVACCSCHKQLYFVRVIEKPKKKEKEKEKEKEKDTFVSSDEVLSNGSESEIAGVIDSSCVPSQECYCVICYVERFCNVHTFQNHDGSDTNYIFKEKGSSGRILYQSSSVIQRLVSSE
jgi:hypothetical protein